MTPGQIFLLIFGMLGLGMVFVGLSSGIYSRIERLSRRISRLEKKCGV